MVNIRRTIRPKSAVTILMPDELKEQLTVLAAESGRTRAAYIRQILRRYLQYLETKDDPGGPKVNWEI